MNLSPCDTTFDFNRHLVPFMQNAPFFAEISRHIRKFPTRSIPTAAVTFNPVTDELCLVWNPDFFESLTNWEIKGVLTHEFYHLIFGHLAARRKNPGKMWNIATDLAINSIIMKNATSAGNCNDRTGKDDRPLPRCVLIPGQWPIHPDGREMSKEEKDGAQVAALIASFPLEMASEWYFNKLQEQAQKNRDEGKGDGDGGEDWIDSMDDHDGWDAVPEEKREFVDGKVKSILDKAVKYADQQPNGWGDIPQELREQIRASVSNIVNWRAVLRQFIGSMVRGSRTASIKRINRRYPYIHPGTKRGYVAKLLIARDESGSVYDAMLQEFTSELCSLTRKIEIDFIPFDCYADERDIIRWTRGAFPQKAMMRTRGGGTDFNAPTRIFNDPKNRGRWDGMLILTDGEAPAPEVCRGKRGWVLAKGCQLNFPSQELQIFIDKERSMSGAWR